VKTCYAGDAAFRSRLITRKYTVKLQVALLSTVCLLAGCGEVIVFGHTVHEGHPSTEDKTASTSKPVAAASARFQAVNVATLVLTPQARAEAVKNSRFDEHSLLDAITGELRSRKLLDATDVHANGTVQISIDKIEVRPVSNVILFGQVISAGTLSGNVRVRDGQDSDLRSFRIEADSRLSIAANGEDLNPLKPLYRRFAALAGDSLAGTPGKSSESPDQVPR
jgi:hypothetical protein